MGKPIQITQLTATLHLSECTDGFWLFDKTRGMNLAMKAKTPTDAFVKALTYYQERLLRVETEHRILQSKVDAFVAGVVENEED